MANIPKFKLSYMENGLYKVKLRMFTAEGEYGIDNGVIERDIIVKISKKTPKYATELLTGYHIPISYFYVGGDFREAGIFNEDIDRGKIIPFDEIKRNRDTCANNHFKEWNKDFRIHYGFSVLVENIDACNFLLGGANTLFMDSPTSNLLRYNSDRLDKIIENYKSKNTIDELLDLFKSLELTGKENQKKWLRRQEEIDDEVRKKENMVRENYEKYFSDGENKEKDGNKSFVKRIKSKFKN